MRILIILFLSLSVAVSAQKKYEANWESLDSRPVAEWFEDAKFGIFIHWGPYSVPAWSPKGTYSEWYQYWLQTKSLYGNGDFTGSEVYDYHIKTYGNDFSYYKFGEMFTANNFDADEWASLFQDAGARYMVITSKHHDGYCLWPSKDANRTWGFPWNANDLGAKRDLLKELEVAVKKTEIKFGTYYSLYEWFNPLWLSDPERYAIEHMRPQMEDLVENYKPDILWTDGEWDMSPEKWRTPEFLSWLFNESAVKEKVVINDRWGKGSRFKHGGYSSPEYDAELESDRPWEECRGIGFSFGYNRNEDSWDYSSSRTLVYLLINIVSSGGNLLLDIGPDAYGQIPPIMQDRLLSIGKWLKVNGEAIYDSRKWDRSCQWSEEGEKNWRPENQHYLGADYILKQTIDPEPGYAVREIFFTSKKSVIYAICPLWPKDQLIIRDIGEISIKNISLLGSNINLSYSLKGDDLIIDIPDMAVQDLPCDYAWTFKIITE